MRIKIKDEWAVTRRKLEIGFSHEITATKLKKLLQEIPDSATLDDFGNSQSEITMIFHHETAEKQNAKLSDQP